METPEKYLELAKDHVAREAGYNSFDYIEFYSTEKYLKIAALLSLRLQAEDYEKALKYCHYLKTLTNK